MKECIFCMQIKIEVFDKLYYHFGCVYRDMPKVPKIRSLHILCNIFRKTWGMKLIFCLQINRYIFYKLIISVCLCIAKHVQSTQNNKFAISLQYLKENVKDEVDFLLADKHQKFLQINTIFLGMSGQATIFLGMCGQACPNYLK